MIKRILLISARQRAAVRIQIALMRRGLMVEIARTFRRGLAIARNRPPAAIILDAAIPELDRSGLARMLGSEEQAPRIPLVVFADESAELAQSPASPNSALAEQTDLPEAKVIQALQRSGVV